jgi:hypothetical protein
VDLVILVIVLAFFVWLRGKLGHRLLSTEVVHPAVNRARQG